MAVGAVGSEAGVGVETRAADDAVTAWETSWIGERLFGARGCRGDVVEEGGAGAARLGVWRGGGDLDDHDGR